MFATEPTQPQAAPGIIEAALRYRKLMTAVPLACVLIAVVFTALRPNSFEAVGKVTLTDPRGSATFADGISVVDFARYSAERAAFATSSDVLQAAAQNFPRAGSAADLRSNCSATAAAASTVMTVTCQFGEFRTATGAVDAIVAAYRDATARQFDDKAERALAALSGESPRADSGIPGIDLSDDGQIQQRMAEINTTRALFGDGVDAYDPARVPSSSNFLARLVRNVVIAGIIGFLAAVLIAWFRADREPIGENSADVSSWLGLPMLGEVGYDLVSAKTIDMVAVPEPSFQRITSNIDAVLSGDTVLFTPADLMAHDADVVIKTALVAARAGKRVLLIDADHGARGVSTILGLDNRLGFADVVAGSAEADEATVRLRFGENSAMTSSALFLMGPGGDPSQPPALLRTGATESALVDLRRHYDLILIDGPPLLSAAGSSVLGQTVDGVVVLIERGTSRDVIDQTRRQLDFLASDTLGYVFVHGS
ncbi:MAG: hypothetical protein M9952_14510 [Microthrixaceae bacterium]|nr:hypothetical protein [Microthrixaceae bacterium]MCO5314135.1 hypothetical protein [Microthrixaceae bacterium]